MKQWEYKDTYLQVTPSATLEDKLNQLGILGWEVISVNRIVPPTMIGDELITGYQVLVKRDI